MLPFYILLLFEHAWIWASQCLDFKNATSTSPESNQTSMNQTLHPFREVSATQLSCDFLPTLARAFYTWRLLWKLEWLEMTRVFSPLHSSRTAEELSLFHWLHHCGYFLGDHCFASNLVDILQRGWGSKAVKVFRACLKILQCQVSPCYIKIWKLNLNLWIMLNLWVLCQHSTCHRLFGGWVWVRTWGENKEAHNSFGWYRVVARSPGLSIFQDWTCWALQVFRSKVLQLKSVEYRRHSSRCCSVALQWQLLPWCWQCSPEVWKREGCAIGFVVDHLPWYEHKLLNIITSCSKSPQYRCDPVHSSMTDNTIQTDSALRNDPS